MHPIRKETIVNIYYFPMNIKRKPEWLKIDFRSDKQYSIVSKSLKNNCLHTICVSGRCPNMAECWGRGTATFMILGDICTRSCRFCNTKTGRPLPPMESEAEKLANSVRELKLKHVVITSVDRDDLPDGGATHWARCISRLKSEVPEATVEVLIPDFRGDTNLVDIVLDAKPDIVAHNIETVERMTPSVRSAARYDLSLNVLKHIADRGFRAKSGIMLGVGEEDSEVLQTMDDLLEVGCQVLTIGQYLQPTKQHLEVSRYVTPEQFAEFKGIGLKKGFNFVESGPLVRSSYHAEEQVIK